MSFFILLQISVCFSFSSRIENDYVLIFNNSSASSEASITYTRKVLSATIRELEGTHGHIRTLGVCDPIGFKDDTTDIEDTRYDHICGNVKVCHIDVSWNFWY